ncbi:ribosome recycling factor family protein [Shewanella olleyana]|uniref:ribosome recycling factor family protein n=1 Tax=Shewanella olleyana TaxID=135626 RepID=UPI00200D07D6|nr:ribosome recycling factor family protein [Shewanella olleyana]MCL1065803.1 ribosome recycling factor family protein [Shewanella olleyana]
MTELITIHLPSLIHRIGREAANQAKVIATKHGCELKRVRRSRNWSLVGEAIKVQSFNTQLKTTSLESTNLKPANREPFGYLNKKIETALLDHADKLEPLEAKLIRLITETPSITLAELIQLTQCTEAQARTARFEVEF